MNTIIKGKNSCQQNIVCLIVITLIANIHQKIVSHSLFYDKATLITVGFNFLSNIKKITNYRCLRNGFSKVFRK